MTKKRQRYYFDVKIKIARALFFLNAVTWLGFAIYLYREMTGLDNRLSAVIIAIFMLGNAVALFISGLLIHRRVKWGYYFSIAVVALNIILTFTDQFGVADFLVLLLDTVLFMILISLSNLYFSKS
jgi:hypothetical protein